MKRYLSMLLCMLMVLSSFSFVAHSADMSAVLSLGISSTAPSVGEVVTVTMAVSQPIDTDTFDVALKYDNEMWEYMAGSAIFNTAITGASNDEYPGELAVCGFATQGTMAIEGTIIEAEFTALKEGTSEFSIDLKDSGDAYVSIQPLSVSVREKTEITERYITEIYAYTNDTHYIGDELDITVYAKYSDNTEEPVSNYDVLYYDSNYIGEQWVTVNYGSYSCQLEVYIEDNDTILDNLTNVWANTATCYQYETPYIQVWASYRDKELDQLISSFADDTYEIIGFDPSVIGEQRVSIRYGCRSTVTTITVLEKPENAEISVSGINLYSNKQLYNYGEELDIVVTALYTDGIWRELSEAEYECIITDVSDENSTTITREITVKYGDYEAATKVEVVKDTTVRQYEVTIITDGYGNGVWSFILNEGATLESNADIPYRMHEYQNMVLREDIGEVKYWYDEYSGIRVDNNTIVTSNMRIVPMVVASGGSSGGSTGGGGGSAGGGSNCGNTVPTDTCTNALYIESFNTIGGVEERVPVYIKNNSGIAGYTIDVCFDSTRLIPKSVEMGNIGVESIETSLNSPEYINNGLVTVVGYGVEDTDADGVLFYITFEVVESAANVGMTYLNLGYCDLYNSDKATLNCCRHSADVEVMCIMYGDVYVDGIVNPNDCIYLAQYFAGYSDKGYETSYFEKLADVYNDGAVDMKDLLMLAKFVARWPGIVLGEKVNAN